MFNFRAVALYLIALGVAAAVVATAVFINHKVSPPSESKEAQELVVKLIVGRGSLSDEGRLAELRRQDKDIPGLTRLFASVACGTLLFGFGLFFASLPIKARVPLTRAVEQQPQSIANELQALAELRDSGTITEAEFDIAKEQLLRRDVT